MSKKMHSRRAIADAKNAFLEVVRHYRQKVGHLFLDFLAYNRNEDVPIRDYFGFIHAVDLPPAFLKFLFVADKSIFKISNSGRTILYFSTFSSIYRPTMEMKTRRFGNISRFFEIHFRRIDFIYFKSVLVEEQYPLRLEGWRFSATKMNFEKTARRR